MNGIGPRRFAFAAPRLAQLAVLVLLGLGLLWPAQGFAMDNGTLVLNTATGAYRFNVEVAVTPEERAKGLMFRQALADDAGMLFLYDESQPIQMWMKNTYIPLDMVFIGADWRVNRVHERAKPFSLTPIPSDGPVIGIVELAAGTIRKTGIKKGDKVDYTPLQPGSAAIR